MIRTPLARACVLVASVALLSTGGSIPTPMTSPGVPATALPPETHPQSQLDGEWGDDTTREGRQASAATGEWQANRDNGSLNWIENRYGFKNVWNERDPSGEKVTGKGVTVALIDTGVAPVPGLDIPGKVINGPDLSFESQTPATRHLDGYGHGTHMAGIIAGRDPAVPDERLADPRYFVGMAPDAQLLNVKVATADGGADVTQVIAAIDWIVQHRNDNGMNVRVINLSYGTHSTQSYLLDPLAKAVENAWRAGIVVVAAAGNDGTAAPLTMPAADPYVISVGAVDHRGTNDFADDTVSSFSSGGDAQRRPDLIAPGKSVVSLRAPGSAADVQHPEGLVPGDLSQRFFRGSGTSQATAVVSGAVALLLQARPRLTPDKVKHVLVSSADSLAENPDPAMGAGVLDIEGALGARAPAASAEQSWRSSTGLGTLEASRGDDHVIDPANGVILAGEVDALGSPWDGAAWALASTNGTAWSGGDWMARSWSGSSWTGTSWAASTWEARSWSGTSWSGIEWRARSWSDLSWMARSWSARSWSAGSWSGTNWIARSWSGISGDSLLW